MEYIISYHPDVKKTDLPKIDQKTKFVIKKAIEKRLTVNPQNYGKPLQKTLKGYWKLRVGNYRVVFKIEQNLLIILGFIHKKDVYRKIQNRLI